MKRKNFAWSLTLGSAFAVTLGALPLTAVAADASAPQVLATARPVTMTVSAKGEGNCSQRMKSKEGLCVSAAMVKTHDGKCGKAYMVQHKNMPM
ncbi:hypothetical protein [Acidithiobacillus sp.]|uniref:hypothetical protein n=1 Tax=Acidithiobacillus sp. TaxID=1872118 RepID=UPI00261E9C0B|nr:hypothetical protein [Acidithiobacillus sp.]